MQAMLVEVKRVLVLQKQAALNLVMGRAQALQAESSVKRIFLLKGARARCFF